jgi:hypothetical protein
MFDFNNYNKGTKYLQAGNFEKAVQFLNREIKLNEFKECYLNLGNAYKAIGSWDKAKKCYEKAFSDEIPFANGSFAFYDLAASNLGLWYYANSDDDRAIAYYSMALTKNSQLMDAIWNYASAILRKFSSGEEVDIESAWKMYEFRFRRGNPVPIDRSVDLWDGITKHNKIVVLAEQGFGDKIMFGRYIHCLEEYCNQVVVQCPPHLDCIFDKWEVCRVASASGATAAIPICSLAGRFGMVDAEWLAGKFKAREYSGMWELNVGVEWSGSVTHNNNRNRSIGVNRFIDLAAAFPGVNFYSFGSKDYRGIKALGTNGGKAEGATWVATAEAIAGLDVLITVDTSVAHMAGSMGKEVWLLQPSIETDFRWGNDSIGEGNIWYPSIKVIRNPGDWDKVFKIVADKLVAKKADIIELRRGYFNV